MAACTACMAAKSKQHSGWVGNIPGHDIAAWWAGNEPQVTSFCENTLVPRMALQANRGTHTSLHRHRGLHWHTHKGCIGTEAMRPTEAHAHKAALAQRHRGHEGHGIHTEACIGTTQGYRRHGTRTKAGQLQRGIRTKAERSREGMAGAQRQAGAEGQKGAERHRGTMAHKGPPGLVSELGG